MTMPMTAAELADRTSYAAELEQLAEVSSDSDLAEHYMQKAAKVRDALPVLEYIQQDRELLRQWRQADQTGIADADGHVWSEANAVQAKVDSLAAENAYRPGLRDEVNRLLMGGSALDTPLSQLAAAIVAGGLEPQAPCRRHGQGRGRAQEATANSRIGSAAFTSTPSGTIAAVPWCSVAAAARSSVQAATTVAPFISAWSTKAV
jgi:cell fate (sporulation/competence/biofilm development) regulator YlbF (YheA/YmcA/DUF963 family)